MAKVTVYNLEGKGTGDIELDDAVFGVAVRPQAVRLAANAQRANAAVTYAHTKDRSEKRGGGKKPWRQKGTGRARHGSSRSPIWRGGGVTFGPRNTRNQDKKINKKARQSAIRMLLTDKVKNDAFIVVDSFEGFSGKTKDMAKVLKALPVGKSAMIATAEQTVEVTRATQNLEKVNSMTADSLNVLDMLQYSTIVCDKAGVEKIVNWLKK